MPVDKMNNARMAAVWNVEIANGAANAVNPKFALPMNAAQLVPFVSWQI